MSPPITGTTMTQAPSVWVAGERSASEKVWKKKRFVKKRIRSSITRAATVLMAPMTIAMAVMRSRRALSAKSPRGGWGEGVMAGCGATGSGVDAVSQGEFGAGRITSRHDENC